MKVVIVAVIAIGWAWSSVAAKEKACSNFCSSLGMLQLNPGKSCDDIYQVNKASRGASGNYWINTTTGVYQVYCNMELDCGGHKGGWMRIADLDANRGDDCPSGWTNITTPVAACVAPNSSAGCYSTYFSALSIPYSRVCGMAVGYQKGGTDAFLAQHFSSRSIDGPYVDGLSITYGAPRKHIWTYAIGLHELNAFGVDTYEGKFNCPCSELAGPLPPSFVHDNYYCESGTTRGLAGFHIDDPVWDGEGCSTNNNCCSEPNLPWFYRQIPLSASEDIETRICHDDISADEDVLVREFQLYVQ